MLEAIEKVAEKNNNEAAKKFLEAIRNTAKGKETKNV